MRSQHNHFMTRNTYLSQPENRGVGVVIILISLLIVAVLAYLNWDKIVGGKKEVDSQLKKPQEKIERFKEDIEDVQDKMQQRLDEGLDQ